MRTKFPSLLGNAGPPRLPPSATVVFLRDQFAMPSEQRHGRNQHCYLFQGLPSKSFSLLCQSNSLRIRESHSALPELLSKNPILFSEVFDGTPLPLTDQTSKHCRQEAQRIDSAEHVRSS